MKLKQQLLLVLFIAGLFACSKSSNEGPGPSTPPLSVYLTTSASQLTVSANANKLDSFTVQSNTNWSLSVSPAVSWITTSVARGNGDAKVYLSIQEDNRTGAVRKVTITLTADNTTVASPVQVVVSQEVSILPSNLIWSRLYGGALSDKGFYAAPAMDGGIIVVGDTRSSDGDISSNSGLQDAVIMKLDATGAKQWVRTFGGTDNEYLYGVAATPDGGYIACGSTDSPLSGYNGGNSGYIIKLDANGNLSWQKLLNNMLLAVIPAADGGYLFVGQSHNRNVWIVKTDDTGGIVWQKEYGGNNNDIPYAVVKSPSGGYVIVATTESNNGDVVGAHGLRDAWVLKIDNAGALEWTKTLGGSGSDEIWDIKPVSTGYVLAGFTYSNDGDVSGNHGGGDVWVVKLDNNGTLQWQKALGGTGSDFASSITLSADGRQYVVAGSSSSRNGDVTENAGQHDAWVIAVDEQGNKIWQQSWGGTGNEIINNILPTASNAYIVTGYTDSRNSYFSTNKGANDIWVFKCKQP